MTENVRSLNCKRRCGDIDNRFKCYAITWIDTLEGKKTTMINLTPVSNIYMNESTNVETSLNSWGDEMYINYVFSELAECHIRDGATMGRKELTCVTNHRNSPNPI